MPRNINAARFNHLCELNYKANPVNLLTCGQFITVCQQQLLYRANGGRKSASITDMVREKGSHLPEKVIRHAEKIENASLAFYTLIRLFEDAEIKRMATLAIQEVRESLVNRGK